VIGLLLAVGGALVAAAFIWWAIRSGERRGNAERRARMTEGERAGADLAYGCVFAIGSVVLVLIVLLAIVVGLVGG
jgi:hypothetical protein